jgi:hypothetical protein
VTITSGRSAVIVNRTQKSSIVRPSVASCLPSTRTTVRSGLDSSSHTRRDAARDAENAAPSVSVITTSNSTDVARLGQRGAGGG